jgi:hypothetical protein
MDDVLAKLLLEGKSCENCVFRQAMTSYPDRREYACFVSTPKVKLPDAGVCEKWERYTIEGYYKNAIENISPEDIEAVRNDMSKVGDDINSVFDYIYKRNLD